MIFYSSNIHEFLVFTDEHQPAITNARTVPTRAFSKAPATRGNSAKFAILLLCILFLSVGCTDPRDKKADSIDPKSEMQNSREAAKALAKAAQQTAIISLINTMTLEEKVAQLFLVSVDGTKADLSATTHPVPPGGYLLFSRNTQDGAEKIISLTGDVQTYYAKSQHIPPYFAIDHEGGEVNRLRGVASPLPSASAVATSLSLPLATELYSYAARQIAALGIQVNLAPVVEVSGEHNDQFLGLRGFGDLEKVTSFAGAFIDAFSANGVYCVLKHFPGNNNNDPHFGLPVLHDDKETVLSLYVEPFRRLLGDNALLMSHAIISAYDDKNPSGLSPTLINTLVKQELKFNGLVFSDDILMEALLQNGYPPLTAMKMALQAGVHVLMLSHPAYWNYLPQLTKMASDDEDLAKIIDKAVIKILEAKIAMGLFVLQTGEAGQLVLMPRTVSELYNQNEQLAEFASAKLLGETLYYEYWR